MATIFSPSAYIAIDDIRIMSQCNNPSNVLPFTVPNGVTTLYPSDIFFYCNSGKVIHNTKVCDWTKDCPGGEDEKYCGDCQFTDHSLCGYKMDNFC